MDRPDYQTRIGEWIVNVEARRDKQGRLRVYTLPSGDGGGKYEIAGINDRYHPHAASLLREFIRAGKHACAEAFAVDYILRYTDLVTRWHPFIGIEAFLRDCAFNRGPGGAAKILQIALGFQGRDVDGDVGPKTRAAAAAQIHDPRVFIASLRRARETYELRIAPPTGARAKFWRGLVTRWDKALAFAEAMA